MSYTSTSRVKQLLNIPSSVTDADSLLDVLVSVANDMVGQEIGLDSPSSTEYTETFDVDWDYQQDIMLTNTPVISITSVTMGSSTIPASDYYVTENGSLRLVEHTIYFSFGRQMVTVVYNAGFASVPESLKHAATLICAQMYNKDPKSGFRSEKTGAYSYSSDNHTIPPIAQRIIDRYRRVFARSNL